MDEAELDEATLALAEELREQIEAAGTIDIGGGRYYVVERDLRIPEAQLGSYVLARARRIVGPHEVDADRLTAATTDDRKIIRWRAGLTLTYAILRPTFLSGDALYELVRGCTAQAARDWERICGVRFEHLEALDGGVAPGGPRPTFTIEEELLACFYALAFLPNEAPERRILLVDDKLRTAPHDQAGIMRHELGHVLGFRHEQIRPEAPGGPVYEPDATLIHTLTAYDGKSVMHYPPEGTRGSFALTEYDRRGAEYLYGGPQGLFAEFG